MTMRMPMADASQQFITPIRLEADFGGALRLYDTMEEDSSYVDVEPTADRLVLFYSDTRVPYEVLPV